MGRLRPINVAFSLLALFVLLSASAPAYAARDSDHDGIPNTRDRDIDGDRIPNKRDRNIDGDRKANKRDREMDADGKPNSRDRDIDADRLRNCPRDRDMDADRIRNVRDRDMDGDGRPNGRDPDIDGDGVRNARDWDMDCDGVRNRLDRDIDGDGLLNFEDPDSDASGRPLNDSIPEGVRLPRSFFGVVSDGVMSAGGGARASLLARIRGTGVGTLRQKFDWAQIELSPGVYDFRGYDSYMAATAQAGFTVLPILFDAPSFRSSKPAVGARRGTYPPRSNREFGDFAARLTRRYGPNGSFWAAHPGVPRRPIRSWQVWNEPHIPVYWPSGPNPGAYVNMVRTVNAAIKQADPGAEVVSAAISESNIGVPLATYVQGMYDSGARGSFDTLAIHPYATAADQTYDIMRTIRRIADRHGDRATPLWVTELGYATGGPEHPFNVGYRGQAELVRRVWASLVRERDRLRLRGLIYFNWQDQHPYAPLFQDFFGLHVGLHELDGRPKPALFEFSRAVHAMSAG